jgi:dinuclear metal center YbgI/SA1388 family protein
MTTIKAIIQFLNQIAPSAYQESYDNAGLIVGDANKICSGILVALDSTEEVVAEAIARNCNLIVAHHPIVFKGLKKITGKNYVERTIIKAIKNDIAIFAIHTNLDNVLKNGVNTKIAEKIGLQNINILVPKQGILSNLTFFCPIKDTQKVLDALHAVGIGQIGAYKDCSFKVEGTGTFRPTEGTNPHIGTINVAEEVTENRIEVILPSHLTTTALTAMREAHPYEEVAYYLNVLSNENQEVGSGMIGNLAAPMPTMDFLQLLKKTFHCGVVKYTKPHQATVSKVAVCGGAGSFLLPNAMAQGADIFVTGDYKYHEFFDAEGRIVIADIGHYESEQFTIDLLMENLEKSFSLPILKVETNTNPVFYL